MRLIRRSDVAGGLAADLVQPSDLAWHGIDQLARAAFPAEALAVVAACAEALPPP